MAKRITKRKRVTRRKPLPNGHRAIMGSRKHPRRARDFFPTPPWATRALMEYVIGPTWFCSYRPVNGSVWEPACGEGHMAEVLGEYFGDVYATDIHDYGYGLTDDFLTSEFKDGVSPFDWIITNPPFGLKTEAFVLRALELARVGVAMFVRLQWLDTIGRYNRIFRDHPPTQVAIFAERVPLCKGRWNPDGSTATAYVWLVWIRGAAQRPPLWIPPGQRVALTRPDDRDRFTKNPVVRKQEEQCLASINYERPMRVAASDGTRPELRNGQ